MINPWLALGFQAARLTFEAQTVIMLRMMRVAGGGEGGAREMREMVPDKLEALAEAGAAMASASMAGDNFPEVANRVMKVYEKRVGRNRRRLSK